MENLNNQDLINKERILRRNARNLETAGKLDSFENQSSAGGESSEEQPEFDQDKDQENLVKAREVSKQADYYKEAIDGAARAKKFQNENYDAAISEIRQNRIQEGENRLENLNRVRSHLYEVKTSRSDENAPRSLRQSLHSKGPLHTERTTASPSRIIEKPAVSEEFLEVGLSSLAELKAYFETITDKERLKKELIENHKTRSDAQKSLVDLYKKYETEKNEIQLRHVTNLFDEQTQILKFIDDKYKSLLDPLFIAKLKNEPKNEAYEGILMPDKPEELQTDNEIFDGPIVEPKINFDKDQQEQQSNKYITKPKKASWLNRATGFFRKSK